MTEDNGYVTGGGIRVHRRVETIAVDGAVEPLVDAIDSRRGVLLTSSYEYPGRYTRWDIGFVDPPVEITSHGRNFVVRALNERGRVLLPPIAAALDDFDAVAALERHLDELEGVVAEPTRRLPEEERSRHPTVFSVLRAICDLFASDEDPHLGLYGSFGYDLVMQFEPLELHLTRPDDLRDLVLYLPDSIVVVDHRREYAARRLYDFETPDGSTVGIERSGVEIAYVGATSVERVCDHEPGEYAAVVDVAKEAFRRGDLFEVVPSRTFFEPCVVPPSEVFRRLRERNPSPYGFVMNLGEAEYLVGASPEMYVRVEGDRVETCPIAGTIARGIDPIDDAEQIRTILNSQKDESELTMCTDVDRNDKARICVPGSVRVIGRRQIEIYSKLIHTVDHVEGRLRPGFDALDAFLTHAWAVTLTGAPKIWAMRFIEEHERSPRVWYGGAVGFIGFNGDLNTGLTIRTMRIVDGVAEVRAGATLLYDSDSVAEEEETTLKAAALLDAIRRPSGAADGGVQPEVPIAAGRRVLLVDHQDSFVHTLADYLRQTGADVLTLRFGFPADQLDEVVPDLVVLSPGPGAPSDFDVSGTVGALVERGIPVFGVCLGLQGIVEHFGGELGVLPVPVHGKPSRVRVLGGSIFDGFPGEFVAGRYHSLFAVPESVPSELTVTARSDDGVVMAVEHERLPVWAVQFHPESILTFEKRLGHRLIRNVMTALESVRVR
ncbi:MAG TPA: anthranilate synthase component I [Actinomycetota bacterium]|jgi:anthranilate synthase|nr:anthranilate synthase component I [Actinomycetota bacterium]